MSLILEGIDIPQKLYTDIRIYKDGRIKKIIGENIMISYNENVQAIQIPKDHGRIGDLDGVIKKIDESPTFASKYKGTARLFIDVYSDSNTILEAEE